MGTCVAAKDLGAVCLQGTAGGDDAVLAANGVKARFINAAEYKPEGNPQSVGTALGVAQGPVYLPAAEEEV